MKNLLIAVIAMILGIFFGFVICNATVKHFKKKIKRLERMLEASKTQSPKKKMGVMDKVLVFEACLLIAYTIADMIVFWHTGSEPYTLTGCVFGVCGIENGVMGWIKTNKEKTAATTVTLDPTPSYTGPEPERQEPPDAG